MTINEIEELAKTVVQAHRLALPIDVEHLAKEEGVLMAPGDFPNSFHGRLEFNYDEGVFILFYPKLRPGLSAGRVRFSICHEFGHYFIEEHRELILSGQVHQSLEAFKPAKNRIEREADQFASALLIPRDSFYRFMGSRSELPLEALLELAERADASIQAAVFRYVQLADDACVAVVTKSGRILRAFASSRANEMGFGRLGIEEAPEMSTAKKCLSIEPFSIIQGASDTSYWFSERSYGGSIWEESTRVGSSDFAVTMLSWPEDRS